ncbi:MAG: PDZ domain-containing protein [Isosphaeraceae bacterium]
MRIRRGSQDQAIALEVKPLPKINSDANEQVWQLLGLRTTPVDSSYVTNASPKLRGGLYVQSVQPGSAADAAHIQKGDILIGMHVGVRHWETIRPENVLFILRQPELSQSPTMQFYIVRRNGIHQGVLNLAELPSLATVR